MTRPCKLLARMEDYLIANVALMVGLVFKRTRVFHNDMFIAGDCLLVEVAMCEEGHMFCKDCLRRGAGVQIGDQNTQISCLTNCGSTFSLAVLQTNLPPTVFSRYLPFSETFRISLNSWLFFAQVTPKTTIGGDSGSWS